MNSTVTSTMLLLQTITPVNLTLAQRPLAQFPSLVGFVTMIVLRQGTNWREWCTQEKGDKNRGKILP